MLVLILLQICCLFLIKIGIIPVEQDPFLDVPL